LVYEAAVVAEAEESYLQWTRSKGFALEIGFANLITLSLERQRDQWREQNHRRSG
jgi:hypothetical protein